MKKCIAVLLSVVFLFLNFSFSANALKEDEADPYVIDFVTVVNPSNIATGNVETRATGLILSYSLSLSKTGTTLNISGLTNGATTVVKCGFKDLTIQRRKTSSDSWEDYYEYGDFYRDSTVAGLSTTLSVAAGYQYRISCKHYAKKSLFVTQTISNTSNIVTVA